MIKYIFIAVGVLLIFSYLRKKATEEGYGLTIPSESGITPENSTLTGLTGDTPAPGGTNPCGCSGGGSKVNLSAPPATRSTGFVSVGPRAPSPGNPLTINAIGQVVSSSTGLPANIFTGGF